MGFMGFGMRKEVYTRKPKEAFKRIKKVYGDDVNFPKSDIKLKSDRPPEPFKRYQFKPLYKMKGYKIIKWSFISITTLLIIWVFFLNEWVEKYQLEQFEKSAFSTYYQNELSEFDEIASFMRKRNDKLVSAGYDSYGLDYYLKIKHPNTKLTADTTVSHIGFKERKDRKRIFNKDRIKNTTLILNSEFVAKKYLVVKREYDTKWTYSLDGILLYQVPPSMLKYLNTNKGEFYKFMQNTKQLGCIITNKQDQISISHWHKKFGRYEIIYTTKRLASRTETIGNYKHEIIVGKIKENVYWQRGLEHYSRKNY